MDLEQEMLGSTQGGDIIELGVSSNGASTRDLDQALSAVGADNLEQLRALYTVIGQQQLEQRNTLEQQALRMERGQADHFRRIELLLGACPVCRARRETDVPSRPGAELAEAAPASSAGPANKVAFTDGFMNARTASFDDDEQEVEAESWLSTANASGNEPEEENKPAELQTEANERVRDQALDHSRSWCVANSDLPQDADGKPAAKVAPEDIKSAIKSRPTNVQDIKSRVTNCGGLPVPSSFVDPNLNKGNQGCSTEVQAAFAPAQQPPPSTECEKLCGYLGRRLGLIPEDEEYSLQKARYKFNEDHIEMEKTHPWLRWVRKQSFDLAGGIVILINVLVICMELEYRGALQVTHRLRFSASDSDYTPPEYEATEAVLLFFGHLFCIVFTIELILRVMAYRVKFFMSIANWLDIIIVVFAILELHVLPHFHKSLPNVTFLRIMRVFRLMKVLRVVRSMRLFHQLRLLVISIYNSVGALCWSILFLTMVQVISAIFMTQMLQGWLMSSDAPKEIREEVNQYFGRFTTSMLTMYEITMSPGAWRIPGRLLIFRVDWRYAFFFCFYGWFVTFTVIRVISALFLKQTLSAAAVDPQAAMMDKIKKRQRECRMLRAMFEHADTDKGGTLNLMEFKNVLEDPQVKTELSVLEIEIPDAEWLFHLLDDGDGIMHLEEFIAGALHIRGNARAMDLASLVYNNHRIRLQLNRLEKLVVNSPSLQLNRLEKRVAEEPTGTRSDCGVSQRGQAPPCGRQAAPRGKQQPPPPLGGVPPPPEGGVSPPPGGGVAFHWSL